MPTLLEPMVVIKIIMLIIVIGISVLCCSTWLKFCLWRRAEPPTGRSSVYVVPMRTEDNNVFRPHRNSYSSDDSLSPPPPYSEVEMKPEMFPLPEGLPPAYNEVAFPLPCTPNPMTPNSSPDLHTRPSPSSVTLN